MFHLRTLDRASDLSVALMAADVTATLVFRHADVAVTWPVDCVVWENPVRSRGGGGSPRLVKSVCGANLKNVLD